MIVHQFLQRTRGMRRKARALHMRLGIEARLRQMIPHGIDHEDRAWMQGLKRGRKQQRHDAFALAAILARTFHCDAPALTLCNLQPAAALHLIEGGANGRAADLQAVTQIPLARHMGLPLARLDALAQALHRLGDKRLALRQEMGLRRELHLVW